MPPLQFSLKLLLTGQDKAVFRGEELLTLAQNGVTHEGFVLVGTKDDTQRKIVIFAPFEVVKHPHIHIHLADVSMGEFPDLQVDEDKTLKQIIIEDKIDIEVGGLRTDPKLATNKRKTLTQFHQKVTQARDKGIFELARAKIAAIGQIEKFQNVGIFE